MSLASELQQEDRQRRAMLVSVARAWLIAVPVLAIRQVIAPDPGPPPTLLHLALDGVGLLLAWWALRPGTREGGEKFMRAGHWSGAAAVPFLVALFVGVADLYRLLQSYS